MRFRASPVSWLVCPARPSARAASIRIASPEALSIAPGDFLIFVFIIWLSLKLAAQAGKEA